MIRQYRLRNYSFPLIAAVIALSVIGIMIIGSAQQSSQNRQMFVRVNNGTKIIG